MIKMEARLKVYIQTDIEGVAGNVFFENRADQSPENFEHRQRMRRLLTGEVDAAVKAAFAAGATEVLVNDSHGSGYNILFEELDPRCEIVHGRNCSGPHWLSCLDGSFAALLLVGMHAMAGTEGANLPHSKWVVNDGELCLGEGSMAAAIAGDHGVPTVFVSGDQLVTAELAEKIPGIETAVVKQALGAFIARSLMPAKARELIHAGVGRGLARLRDIKPYKIPGPLRLSLWDSDDHSPPLRDILPGGVSAASVGQAFVDFENRMPWFPGHVKLPDGFTYP